MRHAPTVNCLVAAAFTALASCGGVQVPEDQLYRLAAPTPAPVTQTIAGALRVERPQIAAELGGDALVVAEGPVRIAQYRFHRWAGPLDSLLGEALVVGLQRARAFQQVLSSADVGHADVSLATRLLACQQRDHESTWSAELRVDARMTTRDGQILFQRELAATVPATSRNPEAVVIALSTALEQIVESLLAESQHALARGQLSPAPGR